VDESRVKQLRMGMIDQKGTNKAGEFQKKGDEG
jgi:hypothetical protein